MGRNNRHVAVNVVGIDKMRMRKLRYVVGLLVAPIVPGMLFSIPDFFSPSPIGIEWYLKFSALVGYPTVVILGIPLYFIFFRFQNVKFLPCVFIGVILGVIAYLAIFIFGLVIEIVSTWYVFITTFDLLFVSATCGAIAATCFWLIAESDCK